MNTNPAAILCAALLLPTVVPCHAAPEHKTWTEPASARSEDPDFSIQGEYGSAKAGADFGVQVVALGDGKFDAYLLEDGLPGLGWTRDKDRILLTGSREGDSTTLSSADKKISAAIRGGKLVLSRDGKADLSLPRIERSSPTLGAKPPQGAVVLFDGSSADQWEKGKVENGLLAATGCLSRKKFADCTIHIEFRTPYKPGARGQARGNSGVYYGGRWETQILDSFGLEGIQNECGGIYSISEPLLNMCLPPLTWQTYDVDFTAAKFDADGKRTDWPSMTVKLNGVLIHEERVLDKDQTTAAPMQDPLTEAEGPIYLQAHGNPVFFRNIWVLPK